MFKCKMKDMIDDLEQLGVKEIKFDVSGTSALLADILCEKGIDVTGYILIKKNGKFEEKIIV